MVAKNMIEESATASNDLINIAIGLGSILDFVIIVSLCMFIFSTIHLCMHAFRFCWVYIKIIMNLEKITTLNGNDQSSCLCWANCLYPRISEVS